MSRRSLLLPAVLAALALPAAPALAGEDPGSAPTPTPTPGPVPVSGSAKLHVSQGCVAGRRAKVWVTGTGINTVTFSLDGKRVKRVTTPTSKGRYLISMRCASLSFGAHRGRAVVAFQAGASPARRTLRFQITRGLQGSPRFTG